MRVNQERPTTVSRWQRKYHRDIGFPVGTLMPAAGMPLTYSGHAKQEAHDDGVARLLPKTLPTQHTVVEVTTTLESVDSWLVRVPGGKRFDLVLAVTTTGVVKTVWVNAHTDTHRTLRREVYARPGRV